MSSDGSRNSCRVGAVAVYEDTLGGGPCPEASAAFGSDGSAASGTARIFGAVDAPWLRAASAVSGSRWRKTGMRSRRLASWLQSADPSIPGTTLQK